MVVGTKSTAVLPAEVTISAHAVDRYIERWAPHLAGQPERASQELAALLDAPVLPMKAMPWNAAWPAWWMPSNVWKKVFAAMPTSSNSSTKK